MKEQIKSEVQAFVLSHMKDSPMGFLSYMYACKENDEKTRRSLYFMERLYRYRDVLAKERDTELGINSEDYREWINEALEQHIEEVQKSLCDFHRVNSKGNPEIWQLIAVILACVLLVYIFK